MCGQSAISTPAASGVQTAGRTCASSTTTQLVLAVLLVTSSAVSARETEAARGVDPPRILFVRGESGSGGLSSGNDSHLCDIDDASTTNGNHGWKTLADLLRSDGFDLVQRIEDDDASPIFPIADLDAFDVLVLGSNNATPANSTVSTVEAWVRAGGGLLVISDANFGLSFADAPTADQFFLDPFGLVMNQDRGTYAVDRTSQFTSVGLTHPILEGVDTFDGEGVSPITVAGNLPPGLTAMILAPAQGDIRRNDTMETVEPADPTTDAALVAMTADAGRVVGHFDRNTFFNENGAGTDITRFDNETFARNLFRWLADYGGAEIFADGFESGDTTTWF